MSGRKWFLMSWSPLPLPSPWLSGLNQKFFVLV